MLWHLKWKETYWGKEDGENKHLLEDLFTRWDGGYGGGNVSHPDLSIGKNKEQSLQRETRQLLLLFISFLTIFIWVIYLAGKKQDMITWMQERFHPLIPPSVSPIGISHLILPFIPSSGFCNLLSFYFV